MELQSRADSGLHVTGDDVSGVVLTDETHDVPVLQFYHQIPYIRRASAQAWGIQGGDRW